MRVLILILIGLCCGKCRQRDKNSDNILSARLDQIKKLDHYDDKIVSGVDSVEYHDMSFPYWNSQDTFYTDDRTRFKYCQYAALKDNVGQRPDITPASWTLINGPHPYLYLRDTARVEDLRMLLSDGHPYVKTYAFGALAFRQEPKLFPVIVDNLSDTTKIDSWWGDSGGNVYPADLMIEYQVNQLTESEKTKLRELIKQNHPYLNRGLEWLTRK
ncbi:MAG: hypothetical protein QM762_04560 [Chryseolinea sp.]